MDAFSELLPVRPPPRRDELLSAWIERIATANGTSYTTFTRSAFGEAHRKFDIDRRIIEGNLEEGSAHRDNEYIRALSIRTNQSPERIFALSLSKYAPALFGSDEAILEKRPLWILPVKGYTDPASFERELQGYRYPYCSDCYNSQERSSRHVRRIWRLSFVTVCPIHGTPLRGSHRRVSASNVYGSGEIKASSALANIESDFAGASSLKRLLRVQGALLRALHIGRAPEVFRLRLKEPSLSSVHLFSGLAKIIRLAASRREGIFLRAHLAEKAGVEPLRSGEPLSLRNGSCRERRFLMLLVATLLPDWPRSLREALRVGGVSRSAVLSGQDAQEGRTGWLAPFARAGEGDTLPTPAEPIEVGKSTKRLLSLRLREVFKIDPFTRDQYALVGAGPQEIARGVISDAEWKRVMENFTPPKTKSIVLSTRGTLSALRIAREQGLEIHQYPKAIRKLMRRIVAPQHASGRIDWYKHVLDYLAGEPIPDGAKENGGRWPELLRKRIGETDL